MTESGSNGGIIALLIISGASFFSTLSIIALYIKKPKIVHSFSFDLVVMLCVSDCIYASVGFFRAIWMLFERDAELGNVACYIEGIIITISTLSSFLCTTSISYALYSSLVKQKPIYRQGSAFKIFWKVNYLIPILISVIIASCSYYGPVHPYPGTLCFISGTKQIQTQLFMLFFYYMPFICSLVFDSCLIIQIILFYKRKYQNMTSQTSNEIFKLACYPVILFICWLPVIVFRILQFFGINSEKLVEIGHISDNIIGFLDVLVYVMISLDPFKFFSDRSTSSSIDDDSQIISSLSFEDNQFDKLVSRDNLSDETSKIFLKSDMNEIMNTQENTNEFSKDNFTFRHQSDGFQ